MRDEPQSRQQEIDEAGKKITGWVQDMKAGFASASAHPIARPTSADEALLLQKALDEQRERIAVSLDKWAKANERTGKGTTAAILFHIASAIRSGEIGGERK